MKQMKKASVLVAVLVALTMAGCASRTVVYRDGGYGPSAGYGYYGPRPYYYRPAPPVMMVPPPRVYVRPPAYRYRYAPRARSYQYAPRYGYRNGRGANPNSFRSRGAR